MRHFIITLLFVLLTFVSINAQGKYVSGFVSRSKAVQFEETRGDIVRKDFYLLKNFAGWTSGLKIRAVIMTDIRTGEKVPYLLVSSGGDGGSGTSVIDYDEIPACIEALEYFLSCETKEKPNHTAIVYIRLRDSLELGAEYWVNDNSSAAVKNGAGMWRTVITHRKYITEPSSSFALKRISEVIDALKEAQKIFQENL